MASKVNTKFVVTLGVTLVIAFVAVVYVAYQSIKKSGDDYIQLGDKAMAEAKYSEAVGLYGKAVYKDQRNSAWIRKWLGAMEKETPKGLAAYRESYSKQYLSAIKALAEADRSDFDANQRWLNERWDLLRSYVSLKELEAFVPFVEETVNAFKGTENQTKKLWRYRGLARVSMLSYNAELPGEMLTAAKKDLEGAIAADPADRESVLSLCAIDLALGERARKKDDKEEQARYNAACQERVAKFIAEHPPAAAARLFELRMTVQLAAQAADRPVTYTEVLQDRQGKVEELIAAVLAEDPAKLELGIVTGAAGMARAVLPTAKATEAIDKMLSAQYQAQPDNAPLLIMLSQFDVEKGDYAAALAKLQQVVDLPDRPMSFKGLLLFGQRNDAVRGQTDVAFRIWDNEMNLAKKSDTTPQGRADAAAALARAGEAAKQAKKYRDDFVARPDVTGDQALPMDARLALINGDIKGATTLLTRYNQQTNERDGMSVFLLGSLQQQQGNTGAAKQAFERVLQVAEDQYADLRFRAAMSLASIANNNGEYGEALKYGNVALKIKPEEPGLKEFIGTLEQLSAGRFKDPVLAVLVKSQAEITGPAADTAKAERIIREALETYKDQPDASYVRLHQALIRLLDRAEKKTELKAAVDAAATRFPDGPFAAEFRKYQEMLSGDSTVQAVLKEIDKANTTPVRKHLARYEVFTSARQPDDATKELAEIAKLAKDDPKIAEDPQYVDYLFDDAMRHSDSEAMNRLAALAEEKNLDQVNGQLYRARVLMFEGKYNDAAQMLRNVVDRDKLSFVGWRLLGSVRAKLVSQKGMPEAERRTNAEAAVDAFAKAVEIRPNDIVSVNGYIQTLLMTERAGEALAYARKAENFASRDADFLELLLDLEFSAPGGDKARAIDLRKKLADLRPKDGELRQGDKDNIAKLAAMQIDQRMWDAAKANIDSLRSDPALKSEVVSLDAQWFARQERFDEAEKAIDDYIATIPPDKLDEGPYLAASRLLVAAGQPDRALKILKKGQAIQKKETMFIDREIGDVCFTARRIPEAIEAYKRVLDAGSKDERDAVAKRVLESYLTLKDWAKFDELMASLGERADKDSTLMVLAAEAAAQQGDTARAEQIYNRAVAADQKNYVVFMKRADFVIREAAKNPTAASTPDKLRDAMADMDQAARLAPTSPVPRMRMAALYMEQGKLTPAIEQLEKAVALDPGNDSLRNELLRLRMVKGDKEGVLDLVEQAIKLKPESIDWLLRGAQVMVAIERMDKAVEYGSTAWNKSKTLRTAIPYVTNLLNKTPPDLAGAVKIVNDPAIADADAMPRHMLRAMVLLRNKEDAKAEAEVAAAVSKLDQTKFDKVDLFMAGLESAYLETKAQIAVLGRVEAKAPFTGYLKVQALMLRMRDLPTAGPAAAELESFADANDDPQLKLAVYRLLGSFRFQAGDSAASVAVYKKLLAIAPNDLEALNNSAYIMATKLKRGAEALQIAEKAAGLAPDSATVLDTLASVHLEMKNIDRAAEISRSALAKATTDNERVPLMIHLAKALILQGKKPEAQQLLDAAGQLIKQKPELDQQFGADLKEVAQQIDGQ
jgi:predicted Zn-dependent protease